MPVDRFLTPFAAPAAGNTGRAPGVWLQARQIAQSRARDLANQAAMQEQNRRLQEEQEFRMQKEAAEQARLAEETAYKRSRYLADLQSKAAGMVGQGKVTPLAAEAMLAPYARLGGMGDLGAGAPPPPPPPQVPPPLTRPQVDAQMGVEPSLDEVLAPAMAMGDVDMVMPDDWDAGTMGTQMAGDQADLVQTTPMGMDRFGFGAIAQERDEEMRAQQEAAVEDISSLALAYAGDPTLSQESKDTLRAMAPEFMATYQSREKAADALGKEAKRLSDLEKKRRRGASGGTSARRKKMFGGSVTMSEEMRIRQHARARIGDEAKISQLQKEKDSYASLASSVKLFRERGANPVVAQRNAIKEMIRAIEGGRITDQDYQLVASGNGLWANLRRVWAESGEGAFNDYLDTIDPAQLKRLEYAATKGAGKALARIRESYASTNATRKKYLDDADRYSAQGNQRQVDRSLISADEFDSIIGQIYPAGVEKGRDDDAVKGKYGL